MEAHVISLSLLRGWGHSGQDRSQGTQGHLFAKVIIRGRYRQEFFHAHLVDKELLSFWVKENIN